MRVEGLPNWLVYAVIVVLVAGVAGGVFLYAVSLTERLTTTTQGTYGIVEDTENGTVEIETEDVTVVRETVVDTGMPVIGEVVTNREEVEHRFLNVTTDEGGGTGEFLDGYEPNETVTLEAVEEPQWQEEGTGEYAADGDEVYLVTPRSDSGRYVIEALGKTELVNINRHERGFPE
jgi:hypothetical protein